MGVPERPSAVRTATAAWLIALCCLAPLVTCAQDSQGGQAAEIELPVKDIAVTSGTIPFTDIKIHYRMASYHDEGEQASRFPLPFSLRRVHSAVDFVRPLCIAKLDAGCSFRASPCAPLWVCPARCLAAPS